jgi:RimJ/RimL family protein N-acetyltransferase
MPPFEPIVTERLLLRPMGPADAADLHARRNDPAAAELQAWEVPYPLERAERLLEANARLGGPANDDWYTIGVDAGGSPIGDLAVHLTWRGRSAEIGYTLASDHWGRGYAVEAVGALIEYLFEGLDVTRISAMLHPGNLASAQVLERCGFLFEGHTRSSYWVGDENSDDHIYGMVREDWETWLQRPTGPAEEVQLIELDAANERTVWRLRTHKSQERFVAPMPVSFADALFPEVIDGAPVVPWMRGVEADGEVVGFAMLALTTEHHPEPYLWRLLIDRSHQRRGIATRALDLIAAECLAMGDETLLTSWEPGRGSPEPFYLSRGFEPTGQVVDGEIEARRRLV